MFNDIHFLELPFEKLRLPCSPLNPHIWIMAGGEGFYTHRDELADKMPQLLELKFGENLRLCAHRDPKGGWQLYWLELPGQWQLNLVNPPELRKGQEASARLWRFFMLAAMPTLFILTPFLHEYVIGFVSLLWYAGMLEVANSLFKTAMDGDSAAALAQEGKCVWLKAVPGPRGKKAPPGAWIMFDGGQEKLFKPGQLQDSAAGAVHGAEFFVSGVEYESHTIFMPKGRTQIRHSGKILGAGPELTVKFSDTYLEGALLGSNFYISPGDRVFAVWNEKNKLLALHNYADSRTYLDVDIVPATDVKGFFGLLKAFMAFFTVIWLAIITPRLFAALHPLLGSSLADFIKAFNTDLKLLGIMGLVATVIIGAIGLWSRTAQKIRKSDHIFNAVLLTLNQGLEPVQRKRVFSAWY